MSREPQVGDTYKVIRKFATLGTNADGFPGYEVGDVLKVVGEAKVNPFNHETGSNLVVECKYYKPPQPESVWAWLPKFVKVGYIELLEGDDV